MQLQRQHLQRVLRIVERNIKFEADGFAAAQLQRWRGYGSSTARRDTTSVDSLVWNGHGFDCPEVHALWSQLPETLKQVAIAELQAGNLPEQILRNGTRAIVLLAFQHRPMTLLSSGQAIRVHPSFANSNYCYDGTFCTYEHIESGCFLAFTDPDYADAL